MKKIIALTFTFIFSVLCVGCNRTFSIFGDPIQGDPDICVTSYISYVNYGDINVMWSLAENEEEKTTGVLPIVLVENNEELTTFKEEVEDSFDLTSSWNNKYKSFNENCEDFTEDFFETRSLLIVGIITNTSSIQYFIRDIVYAEETLIKIGCSSPENVSDDMAGWFITVVIHKENYSETTKFNCIVENK